jgi:hypothetical protein
MTKLLKNVRRETGRVYDRGRSLIVTLEPGDVIGFRPKGTRKTWKTTLGACFLMAVKAQVDADRIAKKAARRGK